MITSVASFEVIHGMLEPVIVFDEVLNLDLLPGINFEFLYLSLMMLLLILLVKGHFYHVILHIFFEWNS